MEMDDCITGGTTNGNEVHEVPTRIMAAACVVFAVGEGIFAHMVAQEHSSFGLAEPSFRFSTKMAG